MIDRLLAAAISVVATAAILAGILWLNQPPPRREATTTGTPVTFQVAPPRKPPPSKTPPPPRTPPPSRPPPPAAMLGASLSGLAFGLSGFEVLNLGASEDVLGGGAAGSIVMTESTVDEVPRPLSRAIPEYPVRARARGVEGAVNLSVLVGEDGAVRDVVVLESEPAGVFEEAAKAAVRAWRFEPGRYQGQAVQVRVQQLVRFTLE